MDCPYSSRDPAVLNIAEFLYSTFYSQFLFFFFFLQSHFSCLKARWYLPVAINAYFRSGQMPRVRQPQQLTFLALAFLLFFFFLACLIIQHTAIICKVQSGICSACQENGSKVSLKYGGYS